MRVILAIDQGTTGNTILAIGHDGRVHGHAYAEFTQHYPRPGWVEHDANEIWRSCESLIPDALAAAKVSAKDVAAIGITNQRETVLCWDRATGKPVGNAIVWQDRRTAGLCDELKMQGLEQEIQQKTGLLLDPYFSGTKLKWMLDNTDGLRDRARAGEVLFGTMDSWIVWNLTERRAHVTDYSNASRTLLYNINDLSWDAELLKLFDIPEAMLPRVVPSSDVCGESKLAVFDGETIPVGGIAGDQQAALFGQACYGEGLAKNTYGTGSFILLNTGTKPVPSKERLLTTIAWRIGEHPVEYALEGAIFITGAAVQWLRDGLQIIKSASETEALASSIDSNDGVYFVPALAGLGAPHWDAYARGTILGLTRGSTRAHIVRAALESTCYQTCDVVRAMERESNLPLRELRVDGGAVGNAFLMQFQSDILGVPVEVPAVTETTALGAAFLAGLAVGFWKSRDEIDAKWQRAHRYEPRMHVDERTRLHAQWLRAVERAQHWDASGS